MRHAAAGRFAQALGSERGAAGASLFLKSKKNIDMLEEIVSQAENPAPLAALLHVLEYDLGYHLYRAVERLKVELSSHERAHFAFFMTGGSSFVPAVRRIFDEGGVRAPGNTP